MTHFVRFAMIGALAAGASIYAIAQDDDSLEALLEGLGDETSMEEVAESEPTVDETIVTTAVDEAETPAEVEEVVADEVTPEADTTEEVAEVVPEATPPETEQPEVADESAEADLGDLLNDVAAEETETIAPIATEPEVEPEEAVEPAVAEDVIAEEPAEPEQVVTAEEPAVLDEPVLVEPEQAEPEVAIDDTDTKELEETEAALETASAGEPGTSSDRGLADASAEKAEDLIAGTKHESEDDGGLQELTEEERKYNDLALLMELKNRGLDDHAYACLKKARSLMATPPAPGKAFEQYADAIKMFKDAKEYLRDREVNLPLKNECDQGILEAEYRQAKVRFVERRYKEAFDLANAVRGNGHTQAEALTKLIQEEMNKPEEIRPTPILPEYAKDDYKKERLAVLERMRRATVYFQLAKYKEANDQLELILRDDPNNEEAINLRARVNRRHADRNRQLKLSTHDEMISQVEANWTPLGALGRNSEELYRPVESKGATSKVNKSGEKEEAVVRAKLQYIRLPEFTIKPPSTLADAVTLFSELAKAYDKPDLPPEERGVSFVMNMTGNKTAADTSSEEDAFGSAASDNTGLPPIASISMMWVSLEEALEMVCDVTGAKYVIKGKTVMIVPSSHVVGKMVTRSYNVVAGLLEKIGSVKNEMASSDTEGWGVDSDSASVSDYNTDSETLKRGLIDLGVPFDGEAKVAYLPTIGKLRVTNTDENLAILENLLEDLNVTPSLIEVETRFVEVSQEDLNSLGFEWTLNSDIVGTVGSGIDWAKSSIQGNAYGGHAAGGQSTMRGGNTGVFSAAANTGTGDANVAMHGGSLSNGMRFLGDSAVSSNYINLSDSTIAPNDKFATFSAVFGRMDVTMILHMLAQRSDTDMLSSPKILAKPGQEALIRVVTEHIYPTEFDITELEESDTNYDNNGGWGSGSSIIGTPPLQTPPVKFAVEPQSFEKMDVGVSMQVMPEVSPEGQMINMVINPKVVEYLGDFDYGMKVPYIQYDINKLTGQLSGAQVEYYNVEMPQPKFHVREINTYVSIYNGSTIVMGGLITETRRSFEDKIPFLGDLPFIGFLFRSKGEYSEKRNLLVFLTARLVDPAGRPLKTATDGRMGDNTMDAVETSKTMNESVSSD